MRLANHSPYPFAGWKRCTTDSTPPFLAGEVDGATYVVGRELAPGLRVVDVQCELPPGGRLELDLAKASPATVETPRLPPVAFFGGPVCINDQPMAMVSIRPDGAAICTHFRLRVGPMLVVNLWTRYYPGQSYAEAECAIVASNPSVPDLHAEVPPLRLTCGDAHVLQHGRGVDEPLLPPTTLADGQGKAFPLTLFWLRHVGDLEHLGSVIAVATHQVGAVGIRDLWHTGNPDLEAMPNPVQLAQRFPEAMRRLYTWDDPVCGPAPVSGITGEQEDQFFHPGGEALALPGAEWVRLVSALKLHAERPCNHLEVNGAPLDVDRHPDLFMWDMRPFAAVSQDMLGKPRQLSMGEANGRWGADTQHLLTNTLVAAARITGSDACQWLLGNMARNYLFQRTDTPGWSTSATFSAREWGYEGSFCVQVWQNLEDRDLAARVRHRFKRRAERILLPQMEGRDHVLAFQDDNRLGPGAWVIAWQESLAAYGLDLAGQVFVLPDVRTVALRVARRMLRDGWESVGGQWLTRAQFPLAGDMPAPDGSFNGFGMPMCAAVVLRHEPDNADARDIVQSLRAAGSYKWVVPGVE